jgi:hypothetical protein
MMRKSKLLTIVYCSALLTGIACTKAQTSQAERVHQPEKEVNDDAVEPVERIKRHRLPAIRSPAYERVTSVRAIDFKNFKYPGVWGPDIDVPSSPFRLAGGQQGDWRDGMKLSEVSYGDVYGDQSDEAIVSLRVLTDGNQAHHGVYVFAIIRNRPRVIFFFESGDRAAGGLKKAYADKRQFVLELWGRGNTLANISPTDDGKGLCCPKTFTRSTYKWRDGAFEEESCHNLPNPEA